MPERGSLSSSKVLLITSIGSKSGARPIQGYLWRSCAALPGVQPSGDRLEEFAGGVRLRQERPNAQ